MIPSANPSHQRWWSELSPMPLELVFLWLLQITFYGFTNMQSAVGVPLLVPSIYLPMAVDSQYALYDLGSWFICHVLIYLNAMNLLLWPLYSLFMPPIVFIKRWLSAYTTILHSSMVAAQHFSRSLRVDARKNKEIVMIAPRSGYATLFLAIALQTFSPLL